MLLLQCLPLIVLGFINLVVALLVLLRGYRKYSNVLFFLLATSVGGWVLGISFFLLTNDPGLAFMWAKVYYLFPLITAASMVLFAYSFPKGKTAPWRVIIPVVLGFGFLVVPLLSIRNYLTAALVYHSWGKEITLNHKHYFFYAVYLLCCFSVALVIFYRKARSLKGAYQSQATLIFAGLFVSAVIGVFFNLVLPWIGNYRLIYIGPLSTNIFVISIAYSIIRHRLFDIRLIVARSLGYIFSLGLLAFAYGAVTYLLTSSLSVVTAGGRVAQILNITLLVIAAMSYASVKAFFDRATRQVFFRDSYDTQALLDEFNKILVSTIELGTLLRLSADLIEKNLKADFTVFSIRQTSYFPVRFIGENRDYFNEKDVEAIAEHASHIPEKIIISDNLDEENSALKKVLEKNEITLLVRLVSTLDYEVGGIGHIFFGAKKSGNPYSKQDIRTLEIIANELVIAIQNALRFEEIEKFNATLQEKIDNATHQLQRNNEKLKSLDESKDEFISMASHQLRTPLTSVKGYLSMVLEGDAGDVSQMQQKLLNQAFISSQRMVYLIADLLNVSRLRTGKFVIETISTNLADVVEGEVSQLHDTAVSRGLTLSYDKPAKFSSLMLDETKIRQVIMNFMDNAIYYTPSGGHITVELKETDKTIEYTVHDDGIGVPKKEQHHLFTKFYRAGNAKKARPDGTGLGLFMAKKVIVAQGGSLIFNSEEGKGSTFGFSFEKAKLLPSTPS